MWGNVCWCGDSLAALTGTVATLFKNVSNTEVCMHNYRRDANIYIIHKLLYTHIYIINHLPQIVQNCIYITLCGE